LQAAPGNSKNQKPALILSSALTLERGKEWLAIFFKSFLHDKLTDKTDTEKNG